MWGPDYSKKTKVSVMVPDVLAPYVTILWYTNPGLPWGKISTTCPTSEFGNDGKCQSILKKKITHCMASEVLAITGPGVGVTKPISSVPLISRFFNIAKTLVTYWISCSYLTGVAAWAAATPVKYECDANKLTGTLAKSKILLTEKLTNGALVTPIQWHVTYAVPSLYLNKVPIVLFSK